MSRLISNALRQEVAARARFRCEYCLVPERFLATTFHIDHIRSIKHGGATRLENLAFACPHCNQNKGSDVATFIDDEGLETIRFYNPRMDDWHSHFEVVNGSISAISLIGAATVKLLEFNQPDRIIFRQALMEAGHYSSY